MWFGDRAVADSAEPVEQFEPRIRSTVISSEVEKSDTSYRGHLVGHKLPLYLIRSQSNIAGFAGGYHVREIGRAP